MSLGQVVHQHPAPLEAQHAGLTLVDKPVEISGGNLLGNIRLKCGLNNSQLYLGNKPCRALVRSNSRLLPGRGGCGVHPLHVLSQLVFPLELFATVVTHELLGFRVSDHVDFQFVLPGEAFITIVAGKSLLCMECSDMFSDLRVLAEGLVTVRAGEDSITLVYVDVLLQTGHLGKLLSAYRTVVQSPGEGVGLDVTRQGTVGQKPLTAVLALQRFRLITAMYRHVFL